MSDRILYSQLHPDLKLVVTEAKRDGARFLVIQATRGRDAQDLAHRNGRSNAAFGESPHNYTPALGFDFAPDPIDWNNLEAFKVLAQRLKDAAKVVHVDVTWGGDWVHRKDWDHLELTHWKELRRHATLSP